jgi:hypothetical protein
MIVYCSKLSIQKMIQLNLVEAHKAHIQPRFRFHSLLLSFPTMELTPSILRVSIELSYNYHTTIYQSDDTFDEEEWLRLKFNTMNNKKTFFLHSPRDSASCFVRPFDPFFLHDLPLISCLTNLTKLGSIDECTSKNIKESSN